MNGCDYLSDKTKPVASMYVGYCWETAHSGILSDIHTKWSGEKNECAVCLSTDVVLPLAKNLVFSLLIEQRETKLWLRSTTVI